MVRIRLRRTGSKRQAHYRIVVSDIRSPRDGRYIEIIGHYNPRTQPETVEYKEDRALYWLANGAQPSEAIAKFFERAGTMERLKRLHAGESIESLVAEAESAKAEVGTVSPRTRYKVTAKAEPAPVAEIVDDITPAAEVETEVEAEVEAEASTDE